VIHTSFIDAVILIEAKDPGRSNVGGTAGRFLPLWREGASSEVSFEGIVRFAQVTVRTEREQ
jgi:hypothetical protein